MQLQRFQSTLIRAACAAAALLAGSAMAGDLYVLGSPNPVSLASSTWGESDAELVRHGRWALQAPALGGTEFKGRLGYLLTPHFAVEGGYVDMGPQSYATSLTGNLKGIDARASGVNVSALGIVPISYQLSIFGKVGYTVGSIRGTELPGAVPMSTVQDKSSFGLGLGGIYQITNTIGVRAEWERAYNDVNLLTFGLQAKF